MGLSKILFSGMMALAVGLWTGGAMKFLYDLNYGSLPFGMRTKENIERIEKEGDLAGLLIGFGGGICAGTLTFLNYDKKKPNTRPYVEFSDLLRQQTGFSEQKPYYSRKLSMSSSSSDDSSSDSPVKEYQGGLDDFPESGAGDYLSHLH